MIVLGLCGSSGSGKSTVASCMEKLGVEVLDCDAIYHELISAPGPCANAIAGEFGADLLAGGSLDRNRLREIVFADEKKRLKLNRISHRFVKNELKKRMKRLSLSGCQVCLIDAPLLFEARIDRWCDAVIGVIADSDTKIKRIVQRDGITEDAAALRLSKQIDDDFLNKNCGYLIINNGSLLTLEENCKTILQEMLSKANQ